MMDVIVLYALIGLCLILAYTLFSESHIFLGLLAVIFGICLMIQMAGSIGWLPVLVPVIIIVGIVIVVYLIKFIYIMITASTSKTTKKTEKKITTPKYTEEDIQKYADRLIHYLMEDIWEAKRMSYPDYVCELIDSIIQKKNIPQHMASNISDEVAEIFECIYISKSLYLKDVLESLEVANNKNNVEYFSYTDIGVTLQYCFEELFQLDSDIRYRVIDRVRTFIEQELLESELNDAQFRHQYKPILEEEIDNAVKESNLTGNREGLLS